MHRVWIASGVIFAAVFLAMPVYAQDAAPVIEATPEHNALASVYAARPDLQKAFRASDWSAVAPKRTAGVHTLEEWAQKYGYKEHPDILAVFAPGAHIDTPKALLPVTGVVAPTLRRGAHFDFSTLTASSVFVVDVASRATLMSYSARVSHPLASITKLMTAFVSIDHQVPMSRPIIVVADDEVGGARLSVRPGAILAVRDILNVALIGSANNMANALARSTKLSKPAFVTEMNTKAKALGLSHTTFVDPTGIEVDNVSTALEIAALGLEAFALPDVVRATTTARYSVTLASGTHTVKNTNGLLIDDKNGLYVLGGKTGYLEESKWNLVVKLRDARMHPIEVVVLGAANQRQSFNDAATVARWVWSNYDWQKSRR